MSAPLLATKLFIPPPRSNLVVRTRLLDRLDETLRCKLTLISAPAGFGKTTLVSNWLHGRRVHGAQEEAVDRSAVDNQPSTIDHRSAWLSLDEADNDFGRFLTYLIGALQTVAPAVGEGVLGALESPQPSPPNVLLTVLVNEIAALPDVFTLVLDDYHVIENEAVDEALTFLLDHLPPQMHLIITTREDPLLPLSRLRARGELVELRAGELRFTAHEAAEFLNRVMGFQLAPAEIDALEARTEGWIAGLQLAALSLRGRTDVHSFIQSFTGDNRYIVDYLVDEVLARQPAPIRRFLLQTSILDRLTGPLCDAVLLADPQAAADPHALGSEILEALDRANLFLVPLDDTRQWFRYHHLFADVLQTHLLAEAPELASRLHLQASRWFEANGEPAVAIRHAFAAGDYARAAALVELEWPAMDAVFQYAAWLTWAQALPDELVRDRPVLCISYAWAHLNRGELEAGETRLRTAEAWLERLAATDVDEVDATMVVADEAEFQALPANVASARAFLAQAHGDTAASVAYAQRALALLPEEDYQGRAIPGAVLGLAYWSDGELETAYHYLADSMADFRRAGNVSFSISGTYGLADILIAQGRLRSALRLYGEVLTVALDQGQPLPIGTAELYLGMSIVLREQGDAAGAARNLAHSKELGEHASLADWPYRSRIVEARMKEDAGDLAGALALLDQAERLYYPTPVPAVRPIHAEKARIWVKQGRLHDALAWAQNQNLSVDDEVSFAREFEHMVLARILMAQAVRTGPPGAIQQALKILTRLLAAAEAGARWGSVIEIEILLALAYHGQGKTSDALAALAHALTLAEPEGYVRVFVNEGRPMAELLQAAAADGIAPAYAGRLLAACEEARMIEPVEKIEPAGPSDAQKSAATPAPDAAEPLSERELDVLRLLRTEMTGPEIARELVVSLNTMRTHTKNIYSKLGVHNRRAAVRRAEELQLL